MQSTSRCQFWVTAEGSTGDGGSTSMKGHSHDCRPQAQLLTGCWQWVSVPCHAGRSTVLLTAGQLTLLRVRDQREREGVLRAPQNPNALVP